MTTPRAAMAAATTVLRSGALCSTILCSTLLAPAVLGSTASQARAAGPSSWTTCSGTFNSIATAREAITPTVSSVVTIRREQYRTVVTAWTRIVGKPCHFTARTSYGFPNHTERQTASRLVLYSGTPSTASPYAPGTRVAYDSSRQVMVADRTNGTQGTWARYEYLLGRGWVKVGSRTTAVFGRGGVVPAAVRRQDTNTTPAGTFGIKYAFGEGNPGTRMPYRTIGARSVWVDRPTLPDYNRWRENGSLDGSGQGEDLSHYRDIGLYRQAAVTSYNYDRPVRRGNGSGAGIFLHYATRWTGGCVGLDNRAELDATIRWMRPDWRPTIVIKA